MSEMASEVSTDSQLQNPITALWACSGAMISKISALSKPYTSVISEVFWYPYVVDLASDFRYMESRDVRRVSTSQNFLSSLIWAVRHAGDRLPPY